MQKYLNKGKHFRKNISSLNKFVYEITYDEPPFKIEAKHYQWNFTFSRKTYIHFCIHHINILITYTYVTLIWRFMWPQFLQCYPVVLSSYEIYKYNQYFWSKFISLSNLVKSITMKQFTPVLINSWTGVNNY